MIYDNLRAKTVFNSTLVGSNLERADLRGVDLRGAVRTRSRSFGGGVYETESYTGDGPTLDIRVVMGLGGLTIRTV